MNFIAMDFETANSDPWSAVSLGLVLVNDNHISGNWYSLIKPAGNFSPFNSRINGLTADDVVDSPSFPEIWQQIKDYFQDLPTVVGHNIRFDNNVLKSSLNYYGIPSPHYVSLDTVLISRKFHPHMSDHKLNTVALDLGVDLQHHHTASDDALAAAEILLYEINHFGEDRIKDFGKFV
ncbi:3'-5' exonuclease [Oenococcus alcoholitolerans]|uniref:3'-5' exonuclease n=1 Tax=Oenococcus alcoholitolerans TaxID=931074 RepID=UPI003F723AFC